MKNRLFILIALMVVLGSCGMMQSIVKSTFPYTTTLTIPASSIVGREYSAVNMANSFDQNFAKNGNNGKRISQVRIISAKLQSTNPSDFNIGNLASVSIYMSKDDGKEEILVASRTDITPAVGNSLVLDIDNSQFLDALVREPHIRIRMSYKLRNQIETDASLHVILGLGAYPSGK